MSSTTLNPTTNANVLYRKGDLHAITILREDGKSMWASKSKEELSLEYPDCIWVTMQEFHEHTTKIEDNLCGQWKVISFQDWDWYLGCLPPLRHTSAGGVEMFRMMEAYTGNIRTVCVKYINNYYESMFRDSVKSDDIAKALIDFLTIT